MKTLSKTLGVCAALLTGLGCQSSFADQMQFAGFAGDAVSFSGLTSTIPSGHTRTIQAIAILCRLCNV